MIGERWEDVDYTMHRFQCVNTVQDKQCLLLYTEVIVDLTYISWDLFQLKSEGL